MAFDLIRWKDLETLAILIDGLLPYESSTFDHLDKGSGWDIGFTGSLYYVDLELTTSSRAYAGSVRMLGSWEDAGTGSGSCAFAAYMSLTEGGRTKKYHLLQGVEVGRRCDIFVEVMLEEGKKEIEELKMSGAAVEVMEGVLTVV